MRKNTALPYELAFLTNEKEFSQIYKDLIRSKALEWGFIPTGWIGVSIGTGICILISPIKLIISSQTYETVVRDLIIFFGFITATPGLLIASIISPIYSALVLRDREYLYTELQVNIAKRRLNELASSRQSSDQVILEQYGRNILQRYGNVFFQTEENKVVIKYLKRYYNEPNFIKSKHDLASKLIHYLTVESELENGDEKLTIPRNQGKQLFNIIVGVASGSAEKAANGIPLSMLLGIKTSLEYFPPVLLDLIASFLSSDETLSIKAQNVYADVKAICFLKDRYNDHVEYFERNATKDIFKVGENSVIAMIRLMEKAKGKTDDNASVKTLKEVELKRRDKAYVFLYRVFSEAKTLIEKRNQIQSNNPLISGWHSFFRQFQSTSAIQNAEHATYESQAGSVAIFS